MATSTPSVVAAAAAAVLTTEYLSAEQQTEVGDTKYFVHPHVAKVDPSERALLSYLDDIYSASSRSPIEVPEPSSPDFKSLAESRTIVAGTRKVAEALAEAMEGKRANPGIVFGFNLKFPDGGFGHGIIKADLEDAQRFFMEVTEGGSWTIGSVRDILPPPQTKYAKFAILPRPKAPGAAGIRDTQAEADSAADYLLSAIGVVVPRRTGTKRAVALAAQRVGYEDSYIRKELDNISTDTALDDVVESSFKDIPKRSRRSLRGSEQDRQSWRTIHMTRLTSPADRSSS